MNRIRRSRTLIRLVQIAVVALLAAVAIAPVQAQDPCEAGPSQSCCKHLCTAQEAYCAAMHGTLVGDCSSPWDGQNCTLPGCDLP